MNFKEATDYVIESKKIAYAFKPYFRSGKVIGGYIYIMYYECHEEYDPEIDDERPKDTDYVFFIYIGSGDEYDQFNLNDVGDDAKELIYEKTDFESSEIGGFDDYVWNVALKLLSGLPKEKAWESYPCPDCDQILYKTGKAQPCLKCKNT